MTDISIDDVRRALDRPAPPSSDFDLNPDVKLPEGRKLRPAAVLMMLEESANGPQVILTKRSAQLKHHPGQIAFPGGKKEEFDATLWDCAVREAQEEIGTDPAGIEPIGTLPDHETVTSFLVSPQVGLLTQRPEFKLSDGEVAEVFSVPLAHLMERESFRVEGRIWQGVMRYYYTVPWGPYYIWGATARILRGLAERVRA